MAEADTYSFDLKEVTVALIKHHDLHEGLWTLAFEFNFGAGLFGPTPQDSKPGALMAINKLQLVRQRDSEAAAGPTVDAAEVNPAVADAKPAKSSSARPRGRG
jgi:hypothetical protein